MITEEEIGSLALKDIRILWSYEEGKISKLKVAEFTKANNPQYLYKEYDCDIGNCFSRWDQANVAFIIFDIFVRHEFLNNDIKINAWDNEFRKIKEVIEVVTNKHEPDGWFDF